MFHRRLMLFTLLVVIIGASGSPVLPSNGQQNPPEGSPFQNEVPPNLDTKVIAPAQGEDDDNQIPNTVTLSDRIDINLKYARKLAETGLADERANRAFQRTIKIVLDAPSLGKDSTAIVPIRLEYADFLKNTGHPYGAQQQLREVDRLKRLHREIREMGILFIVILLLAIGALFWYFFQGHKRNRNARADQPQSSAETP